MIRVVSWNVASRRKPLNELREMDVDVALLQEVGQGVAGRLPTHLETGDRSHWDSYTWTSNFPENQFKTWRKRWPMVVRLSDRVEIEWFAQVGPKDEPKDNELRVSNIGLLAVARVIPKDRKDGDPFIAASMYAHWNPTDGASKSGRSISSDLAALVGRKVPSSHRILAAGDLNMWHESGAFSDMQALEPVVTVTDPFDYIYHMYKESDRYTVVTHHPDGHPYRIQRKRWKTAWGARRWIKRNMASCEDRRHAIASGELRPELGFWDKMDSLGFEFMGPQYPDGRQAVPVPEFMPSDTRSVVTFRRPGQMVEDADQQLDYVLASRGFHESIATRAMNSVGEWGSSDHCRILIEVSPEGGA